MDLAELRQEIDKMDDSLVSLFGARMDIAAKIAEVKKQTGAPIIVPAREREKLQEVAQKASPEMANYTRVFHAV